MCKIMMLTGIQDSDLALKFMRAASVPMSLNDRDGIGYSAINSNNELFMEKWHNNNQFLDDTSVLSESIITELAPYKARLPDLKVNYGSIGNVTRNDIRTVTMHTRMATCGREFKNTHPFVDQGVSLIHNGVLTNASKLNLNKISTCDSENALQLYINNGLNLTEEVDSFQTQLIDKLQGYWAFGILAKGLDGQYMLDIVREGAQLYWSEVPELGENCLVFSTTENIINTAIAAIGLPKRSKVYSLPESYYARYNAVTGENIIDFELDTAALNKYPVFNSYVSPKVLTSPYSKKGGNLVDKKDYSDPHYYRDYDMYESEYDVGSKDTPNDSLIGDDFTIEGFYDTAEPLIDRVTDFDKLMYTNYMEGFENITIAHRVFLERKEEEGYLIFDDILKIVEEFNATKRMSCVFEMYRELKRA